MKNVEFSPAMVGFINGRRMGGYGRYFTQRSRRLEKGFLRGEQVEPIEPKISTKVARVDNGIYDP